MFKPVLSEHELHTLGSSKDVIAESSRNIKTAASPSVVNVFLSYSSKDVELITSVKRFLGSLGVSVYIDLDDAKMPDRTSAATAARLVEQITDCNKFILLATTSSAQSRWVPWELGTAHGTRGIDSIALLGVQRTNRQWTGNEYFNIYPEIARSTTGNFIVVPAGGNRGKPLDKWLLG